MKAVGEFLRSTLIGGFFIILPVALIIALLGKFIATLQPVTESIADRMPLGFRHPATIGALLTLLLCFLAGLLAATHIGRRAGKLVETTVLDRIPGYSILRSFTRRVGNVGDDETFATAFVEIEDCLVLAFIIEEHADGNYTVFVPSAPTPAVGAVYIIARDRVHPVDAPFLDAVKCITKFGAGSASLVAKRRPRITEVA